MRPSLSTQRLIVVAAWAASLGFGVYLFATEQFVVLALLTVVTLVTVGRQIYEGDTLWPGVERRSHGRVIWTPREIGTDPPGEVRVEVFRGYSSWPRSVEIWDRWARRSEAEGTADRLGYTFHAESTT